jgi:hypothetical protein
VPLVIDCYSMVKRGDGAKMPTDRPGRNHPYARAAKQKNLNKKNRTRSADYSRSALYGSKAVVYDVAVLAGSDDHRNASAVAAIIDDTRGRSACQSSDG